MSTTTTSPFLAVANRAAHGFTGVCATLLSSSAKNRRILDVFLRPHLAAWTALQRQILIYSSYLRPFLIEKTEFLLVFRWSP